MALSEADCAEDLNFKLRPFLEICAVDPLLSFNAGHLANISNQPRLALYRFLTCALRQRGDTQAWACAIAAAFQAKETNVMALLVESAYFYVGEKLIDAVLKAFVIPAGLSKDTATDFQRQLIELIRSTVKSADNSLTMWIHNGEHTKIIKGKS